MIVKASGDNYNLFESKKRVAIHLVIVIVTARP
jgi:hypothetical protein